MNEFSAKANDLFKFTVLERRERIMRVEDDVRTLILHGAMDSFVHMFLERSDGLFNALEDRGVAVTEDELRYTDHNGCQWLFDVRKPHLGWV